MKKKCFLEAKETQADILYGDHRNHTNLEMQ